MTMTSRRLAPIVLCAGAVACGGGTPDPSPSPAGASSSSPAGAVQHSLAATDCPYTAPGTRPVTITIVNDGAAGKCRVDNLDPDPIVACVYDISTVDEIEWRLINKCDVKAKVQIANRKLESAAGTVNEPFTTSDVFEKTVAGATVSAGTVTPGKETIDAQKLVYEAGVSGEAVLYKYDITGDVKMDPEIDVRRGTGMKGSPKPTPSPAPSPGP